MHLTQQFPKTVSILYSIEDEGVAVFKRDKHGDLIRINSVGIDGMRGCFLATDVDGQISLCGRIS